MFVFTDEAGDNGLNSQDKYKIIIFSHFFDENDIKDTVESFKKLSKFYFGNSLRSWKKQKGMIKNNPEILNKFLKDFLGETDNKFLLSVGIIEKNKEYYKNPSQVKDETINLYANLFRRGIPFYKWAYYNLGGYKISGTPKIRWYIDQNDDQGFTKPLIKQISEYSKLNNVKLEGPKFLPKPKVLKKNKSDSIKILYSQTIEMTDNFSGIILKGLNNNDSKYDTTMKLIFSRAKYIKISIGEKKPWKWDNIMISPMDLKMKYIDLIGYDYYNVFDEYK
ncbi:hypothetical protein XO10_00585 [Marinitoga sp. 1135]|uniref:hypothetical protein n=1 Tax=Marinitoga sp. 1135 TaxID=1643333 RepID=UPI0015868EE6|nr:hypothetical protein [Marinitoga sp. 1135]NUU94816.1 hypothetical protein [Marinitoga sp. 1135]